MVQVILYLHIIGAVLMGFYLTLPFLLAKVDGLPDDSARQGSLQVLAKLNRVGQVALLVAFLSGGYLVGTADYPTLWWILATVLVIGIGASSGIMGGKMKKALQGGSVRDKLGAIRSLSIAAGSMYFLVITLMLFPHVFV
ncbi:hypothetical protein [Paenibacillus sp. 1P07SE]|uniref:hypothetical protein n=1 Tax=Paenibacillus sp. 1P07SE TaxID=3132209 RepID=UPI0039A6D06C